jgi:hypothetical protein
MYSAAPEVRTGTHAIGTSHATPGKSQTIIRISPSCKLLPHLSVDAFRNIPGVHEVHVDTTCKTIRIVFDGMKETVGRMANYLCSCERKPRYGAEQPM